MTLTDLSHFFWVSLWTPTMKKYSEFNWWDQINDICRPVNRQGDGLGTVLVDVDTDEINLVKQRYD